MEGKKTESQRVSLPEAAAMLGVSPQSVREHMKRGLWDLGRAEKAPGRRGNYYIYRAKLEKFLGERE